MPKGWKRFDFEGGGLQSVNLALARRLKKRSMAYFLWLFFPTGAHCLYLEAPGRAAVYGSLSLLAVAAAAIGSVAAALALLLPLLALALYDLRWIDRRLVQLNKDIRMRVYMQHTRGAPAGFRGHYTDEDDLKDYLKEKERERGGHQPATGEGAPAPRKRAPSFAEQEARLRETQRKEKREKRKE